ncbi:MAG: hypothetical protein ACPL5I_12285 [Thermodesulfobacteriota bacterium]
METKESAVFVKELKRKVEEEMNKKEMETILYWKQELEKVLAKRHESMGALQADIQSFLQRMQNRVKVLKSNLAK